MKIRGSIATSGSLNSGTVARTKLVSPNIRPIIPPTNHPSITPPTIAGMCIVVAAPAAVGTGTYPKGVKLSNMAIADKTPAITIRRTVNRLSSISY